MAIEQAFTTAHGIDIKNAYWRVYKIELNILKSTSTIVFVQIYKDANARGNNLIPVDTLYFDFGMDITNNGVNPIKQAYISLKTQTNIKDDRGGNRIIDLSKAKDV